MFCKENPYKLHKLTCPVCKTKTFCKKSPAYYRHIRHCNGDVDESSDEASSIGAAALPSAAASAPPSAAAAVAARPSAEDVNLLLAVQRASSASSIGAAASATPSAPPAVPPRQSADELAVDAQGKIKFLERHLRRITTGKRRKRPRQSNGESGYQKRIKLRKQYNGNFRLL